jgi:hypothetical protein
MTYITVQFLSKLGMCDRAVEEFESLFGSRAYINKENLIKALDNYGPSGVPRVYYFLYCTGFRTSPDLLDTLRSRDRDLILNKIIEHLINYDPRRLHTK